MCIRDRPTSQRLISYFSELRYSSLPGSRGAASISSNAGPYMPQFAASVAASTARTMNAGRPPCCRYSCRMSGVWGQMFGRKYSREGSCDSSVKYSCSSHFVLRQVKYVYDCVKPSLASLCITRGRVKASDRKITSGCFDFSSEMHHSQKSKALVCGLSTRKIVTPWPIQNSNTLRNSSHRDFHWGESKSNG